MRILHIETGRHLYGGAYQVVLLLRGLAAHPGVENVLCAARGSAISSGVSGTTAHVCPLSMAGDVDPRFPYALHRIIRRWAPDVIHVHSRRGADWWGGLLAKYNRIPALITRRVDNPEIGWAARMKYGLYQRVAVISHGIKNVLLRTGVPEKKMVVIPSSVEPESFEIPCRRSWFLETCRPHEEHIPIAMIAQFIPRKGHQTLVEAAPRIVRKFPMVRFLLFGRGPLQARIKEEVKRRSLDDHFLFMGYRSDLPRFLPCVTLVVHPARLEGLGVSLIQAAAAGRPIVACRAGGIPEVVRDGFNGLLVPPSDPEALAEAVAELLENPHLRHVFGENGRKYARSKFHPQKMVSAYLKLYSEIRSGRGTVSQKSRNEFPLSNERTS